MSDRLTDNCKFCSLMFIRMVFTTAIMSGIGLVNVGDGEDTGGAVGRFHKSRIKQFLVSTSAIEYVTRTIVVALESPEDI